MNRFKRGPLVLAIAGIFLTLAVVSYLINDAQDNYQRRAAALRDLQVFRAQVQRSRVEMQAFREESDRNDQDRAELQEQYAAILKALERIERLLEGAVAGN